MNLSKKLYNAHIDHSGFLSMGLVCVIFLFLPLIWHDKALTKRHLLSLGDSKLGLAVQKSTMLPVAHICLIASSLPLIFDIVCDVAVGMFQSTKLCKFIGSSGSPEFTARLWFVMMNVIPSSVYLHMRLRGGSAILPFYYAAANQLTVVVTMSCFLLLLNSRRIAPSIVMFTEQATYSIACVLKMFILLFPSHHRLMPIATALVVVACVCFAVHMALWLVSLRRRYLKDAFKMDTIEILCLVYS
jgi:hypothetical protein